MKPNCILATTISCLVPLFVLAEQPSILKLAAEPRTVTPSAVSEPVIEEEYIDEDTQEEVESKPRVPANFNYYVGIGAGMTRGEVSNPNPVVSDTKGTVGGFYAGIAFPKFGSIEIGEQLFTQRDHVANGNIVASQAEALYLAALPHYVIGKSFWLYGRLGFAHVRTAVTLDNATHTSPATSNGASFVPTYGIGGRFRVDDGQNNNWGIGMEYARFGNADIYADSGSGKVAYSYYMLTAAYYW